MYKIATEFGYDYYKGTEDGRSYYCLVLTGQPAPTGGYYTSGYACMMKGVPNLFL